MNALLLGLIGGLYVGLLLFVWSLGRMAALSDNRWDSSDAKRHLEGL